MPLTEEDIEAITATGKAYRRHDSMGLYMQVSPTGARYWRYRYRFGGVEKLLALGKYPDISLEEARQKHSAAKAQVVAGIDPCQVRKTAKPARTVKNKTTFQTAALDLLKQHAQHKPDAEEQRASLRFLLEHDVFPHIGTRPVLGITPLELITVLSRKDQVSRSTSETLAVRHFCTEVIRTIINQGNAHFEPVSLSEQTSTDSDIADITTLEQSELKAFFTALQNYQGDRRDILATRLLIYTGVSIKALCVAAWTEFDFDNAIWTIPANRMGTPKVQYVPLSTQSQIIIKEIKEITDSGPLLFPSRHAPQHPMSDARIKRVLEGIGYANRISVRSFHPLMRKILAEQGVTALPVDTLPMEEHRKILQIYADFIQAFENGGMLLLARPKITM